MLYFNCYANGMADRLTFNHLRANLTPDQEIAAMKAAIDTAADVCIAEVKKSLGSPQMRMP